MVRPAARWVHVLASLIGLTALQLGGATPMTTGTAGTLVCSAIDALHKVHAQPEHAPGRGHGSEPTAPPAPLTKPVAAARGELIHLQVTVSAAGGGAAALPAGTKVAASVGGRIGPMIVRQLLYHNLTRPLPATNGIETASKPGLFPDALLPLSGEDGDQYAPVSAGKAGAGAGAPLVFWLSVSIPVGTSPGLHRGTFSAGPSCLASFTVQVSKFTMPPQFTQLTGAQFESMDIAVFSGGKCAGSMSRSACYTAETAMSWFESLADQHINSQVWFQLDDLPWRPTYTFNAAKTAVMLNTTANDLYWPKVLALTGSQNWRMPFSKRVRSLPHRFETNATWPFSLATGAVDNVPMFVTGTPGVLNPEFERLFKLLFSATMNYLDRYGFLIAC
eukprot:SAG11_NODE_79_length_17750_cov_28.445980_6_plen_390_part_00